MVAESVCQSRYNGREMDMTAAIDLLQTFEHRSAVIVRIIDPVRDALTSIEATVCHDRTNRNTFTLVTHEGAIVLSLDFGRTKPTLIFDIAAAPHPPQRSPIVFSVGLVVLTVAAAALVAAYCGYNAIAKDPTTYQQPQAEVFNLFDRGLATVTASSEYDGNHRAVQCSTTAQLKGPAGAWCAGPAMPTGGEWLQFTCHHPSMMHRLITMGRSDNDQWVTSYAIEVTADGAPWRRLRDPRGVEVFEGNHDRRTPRVHAFDPPVRVDAVRIVPLGAYRHCSMRADIVGTLAGQPVRNASSTGSFFAAARGMGLFSSSGEYNHEHRASLALIVAPKLNPVHAWCALSPVPNPPAVFLQLSFTRPLLVEALVTKGRGDDDQWVTRFKALCKLGNGEWEELISADTGLPEFEGNTDRDTLAYRKLKLPVVADAVRFVPLEAHGHVAMRADAVVTLAA